MQILRYYKFIVFIFLLGCNAGPKLSIDAKNIIVDDIKLFKDQSLLIPLYNRGNQPLIIENVTTSCKCIVVDFPKSKILPKSSKNIKLIYKADVLGYHTETVTIVSNDPDRYELINFDVNVVE